MSATVLKYQFWNPHCSVTDWGLATYRPPGDDQPGQCNQTLAPRPSLIGSGLLQRSGFEHDHVFDWTIREYDRVSGGNNAAR